MAEGLKNYLGSSLSTAVFVDYECWKFGFQNQFNRDVTVSDISNWFQNLKSKGRVNELHVFGDFRNPLLEKDVPKLRTITSDIIYTSGPETSSGNAKDYTDFIMLDHMYQNALKNRNIEQYVIFSGDGHFSSIATFLKNYQDKCVGVYAVNYTLSTQLKESVNWYEFVSPVNIDQVMTNHDRIDAGQQELYIRKELLQNLMWAKEKKILPTFKRTVQVVSNHTGCVYRDVSAALSKMIAEGYISQAVQSLPNGDEITSLEADWDQLEQNHIL
ncbi:MAG: NYN domain-containing protein [Oscillospiraceae bacterium]|jgi:hypothetical protein|nr:NYN domain-containing protein [Oscillospiraceae bacterium]